MKILGDVTFKLIVLVFILGGTLSYSIYIKKGYKTFEEGSLTPILKSLPDIAFLDNLSKKQIHLKEKILKEKKGSLVHFWGTWCGPCEEELPSFINLSKEMKESGQKFYLIAVNDNKKDLRKFLKRFKKLPENVKVLLDNSGKLMNSFGVVKVPETFVFDEKGKSLKKFSDLKTDYPYYLHTINQLFKNSTI